MGGNTYGLDVLNHHQGMMEDLRLACEVQDLPFDGVVKESAPSQYEINMQHVDDPVKAARQIIMMKRLIKGVATKHGLIASFMAKPFEEEAGNGMHVHCSVLDENGVITKIRFLGMDDDSEDHHDPLARLDAEFVVVTGTLRKMIVDLKTLLGGSPEQVEALQYIRPLRQPIY